MHRIDTGLGRALVWALGALLLAGCVVSELAPGEALKPAADEALVVLSLTHSGQRGYDLLVRMDGPGASRWMRLAAFGQSRDWQGTLGFTPTPRDNPDGKLFVMRLDPGAYRIDTWYGTARSDGQFGDGYQISGEAPAVEFTATAGQVTYAGNVHWAIPQRIDYMANLREATYAVEVDDRSQRDLELLRTRYAGVQAGRVQPRLAHSAVAGQPLRYYVYNHSAGAEKDD